MSTRGTDRLLKRLQIDLPGPAPAAATTTPSSSRRTAPRSAPRWATTTSRGSSTPKPTSWSTRCCRRASTTIFPVSSRPRRSTSRAGEGPATWTRTPFEKLASLTGVERFLKPGVTLHQLEVEARARTTAIARRGNLFDEPSPGRTQLTAGMRRANPPFLSVSQQAGPGARSSHPRDAPPGAGPGRDSTSRYLAPLHSPPSRGYRPSARRTATDDCRRACSSGTKGASRCRQATSTEGPVRRVPASAERDPSPRPGHHAPPSCRRPRRGSRHCRVQRQTTAPSSCCSYQAAKAYCPTARNRPLIRPADNPPRPPTALQAMLNDCP